MEEAESYLVLALAATLIMAVFLGLAWGVAFSHKETESEDLTVQNPRDNGGQCVALDNSTYAKIITKTYGYSTWEEMRPKKMKECDELMKNHHVFSGGHRQDDYHACVYNITPQLCDYIPEAYDTPPSCRTPGEFNELAKDIAKNCCLENYDYDKRFHYSCKTSGLPQLCFASGPTNCMEVVFEIAKVCEEFLNEDAAKPARDAISSLKKICEGYPVDAS